MGLKKGFLRSNSNTIETRRIITGVLLGEFSAFILKLSLFLSEKHLDFSVIMSSNPSYTSQKMKSHFTITSMQL